MANPPSSVTYARVVAQFVQFVADDDDPGQEPNVVPMRGTVTLAPNLTIVPFPGATPNPFTAWQRPITCNLDDEGYLLGPDNITRGVTVISSDSPNPIGDFTYSVSAALEGAEGMSWTLFLAANTETDLTNAIIVPPLSPTDLELALASIYATQAGMIVSGTVNGSGQLVLTKANGVTQIAGTVVGPAGEDGTDGAPGDPGDTGDAIDLGNVAGTLDLAAYKLSDVLRANMTGAITIGALPAPPAGKAGSITLRVMSNGFGITWGGRLASQGVRPIPSTGATPDLFNFFWDGASWWVQSMALNGIAVA